MLHLIIDGGFVFVAFFGRIFFLCLVADLNRLLYGVKKERKRVSEKDRRVKLLIREHTAVLHICMF